MESKKNTEADLEQTRSSYFMVGLILISGLVLAAFTFQLIVVDKDLSDLNKVTANNVTQITEEKKEETPPPPPETPQVNAPPPVTDSIIAKKNTDKEATSGVVIQPIAIAYGDENIIPDIEEEIIDFPDVEATFIGGAQAMMKFIQENIQYPPTSIEMSEQGKVYLSFVVESDGSISNVVVERGVSTDLDREAKRVVRAMPKWTPGEARGKKSRTRCRLPINFQLD